MTDKANEVVEQPQSSEQGADNKDTAFEADVASGMSQEELLQKYLSDEKTIINSVYWADQFERRFNGNWFTLQQVLKKTSFKKVSEALGVLQIMCMVGVCHVEKNKYKITLGKEKKVLLLQKELEVTKVEKEETLRKVSFQFEMKISALEDQIKKMSSPAEESETTSTTTTVAA